MLSWVNVVNGVHAVYICVLCGKGRKSHLRTRHATCSDLWYQKIQNKLLSLCVCSSLCALCVKVNAGLKGSWIVLRQVRLTRASYASQPQHGTHPRGKLLLAGGILFPNQGLNLILNSNIANISRRKFI